MKISGIIFDKDGTLLDFNEFWIPAAQCVIRRILSDYKIPVTDIHTEKALNSIGIIQITCFLTVHSRGKHFWIWRLT